MGLGLIRGVAACCSSALATYCYTRVQVYLPLDLRPKKTRAIRRALSTEQVSIA